MEVQGFVCKKPLALSSVRPPPQAHLFLSGPRPCSLSRSWPRAWGISPGSLRRSSPLSPRAGRWRPRASSWCQVSRLGFLHAPQHTGNHALPAPGRAARPPPPEHPPSLIGRRWLRLVSWFYSSAQIHFSLHLKSSLFLFKCFSCCLPLYILVDTSYMCIVVSCS